MRYISIFIKTSKFIALFLAIASVPALGGWYLVSGQPAHSATDKEATAMRPSSNADYSNIIPTQIESDSTSLVDVTLEWLFDGASRKPAGPVPVRARTRESFAPSRADDLRLTWLGWASVLIHIDGLTVLTDPMLSRRTSPVPLVGPARLHEAPCDVAGLPDIDVVVISHDHYDHLDRATIRQLAKRGPLFAVPLGIGAYLRDWGVDADRIVELGWGDRTEIAGISFQATAARHFSGRGLFDRNSTLWATWIIAGPSHRVFFGGDTGFFPGLEEIGAAQGPFDVTILPIGAYDAQWKDIHLFPEQAVEANRLLGGRSILPIHFATFDLALHAWDDPMERLLWEADRKGVPLLTPIPGQTVDPRMPVETFPWWRAAAGTPREKTRRLGRRLSPHGGS